MIEVQACCSICEHFSMDMGSPHYSEWTPGSPASISCEKSGKRGCPWKGNSDYQSVTTIALRTLAEKCEFFEPHHDLAAVNS